jgi:7-carboxy-7-deazaguanine synthase
VTTLAVSEIFGPTVQGEGPTAGRRAGFVRLGRCNLDCVWCDTPYTWDWDRFDPAVEVTPLPTSEVVARLDAMMVERVVVTGGEPLLQQRGLLPLLLALGERGWVVEVETNGTIAPSPAVAAAVTAFNVSPKLANSGIPLTRRIRPAALGALVETGKAVFKFVVAEASELDEVAALVSAHGLAPVWIMPEGTSAAVVSSRLAALADPVVARGWNLSTRLQVLVWGDERGR